MVIGEDIDEGLDDGVERSENGGEVEQRRKFLNTSDLRWAHDPVLSLSRGKSEKESPKSGLLNQAVR